MNIKHREVCHVIPIRNMTEAENRKMLPVYSGVLSYFPDAILAVANVSFVGNEQHNKGEPLHWDRSKSQDEPDALMRHLIDHASGNIYDTDGTLHLAKVAWRSLSLLQKYLEEDKK